MVYEVIATDPSGRIGVLLYSRSLLSGSEGSPSIGDINGDALPEIVVGDMMGRVYALRGSGC